MQLHRKRDGRRAQKSRHPDPGCWWHLAHCSRPVPQHLPLCFRRRVVVMARRGGGLAPSFTGLIYSSCDLGRAPIAKTVWTAR